MQFDDLCAALFSRTQFRPDFVPVATDAGVDALCIQSGANRISHLTGFEVEEYANDLGVTTCVLLDVSIQPTSYLVGCFGLKGRMLFPDEADGCDYVAPPLVFFWTREFECFTQWFNGNLTKRVEELLDRNTECRSSRTFLSDGGDRFFGDRDQDSLSCAATAFAVWLFNLPRILGTLKQ